jgi:hypothetical protein
MTYTIAALAVETGIAPQYLIDLDQETYKAILQYLKDRSEEFKRASKTARHRRH